jgi:PAS domain S-box-containing protein
MKEKKGARGAEMEWEDIFQAIGHPTIILTPDHTILDANKVAVRAVGISREKIRGKKCYEVFHGVKKPPKGCPLVKLLKSTSLETKDMEIEALGGTYLVSCTPIFAENGSIEKIIHISTDITARKKAEDALRESEVRFRAFIESLQDLAFLKDEKFRHIFINEAYEDFLGKNKKEIIGKTDFELLPKNLASQCRKSDKKTIENGKMVVTVESEGDHIYETRKFPVRLKDGKIGVGATIRDITERKRTENALKESEKKFRTLTENINVGIYRNTVGPKGRFIEANPALVQMFGYKNKEEFLRINVADLYQDPEDRKKFSRIMLKDGFVKNKELKLKKKRGKLFYGSVTAVAIKDKKGKVKYYDGIIEDITEHKKMEESLRESEERFRSIVENSHDGILIVDEDYTFIYVNDELCRLLQYPRDEIVGHDFREFLDEESKKLVVDRYIRRQRGEKVPPRYEFNVLRRDGEKRRVEISSTVIKDPTGNLSTVAQILDITESKKAEEALKESESKYRVLFEGINDAIFVHPLKREGFEKFIEVNEIACNLLGYTREELLNMSPKDISAPEDVQLRGSREGREKLLKDQRMVFEAEHVTKSGKRIPVEINSRTFDFKGRPVIMSLARDITERKKMEMQRERARREAEFYADVLAHDIGNLDQIILGYLHLLKDAEDKESREINAAGIRRSVMGSKRLAESIQILKRMDETDLEEIDLARSLERSVEQVKAYFDNRKITVNLSINPCYVAANEFLDTAFFNLLENAVEYTFSDPTRIDIRTEKRDRCCVVHIRDYGIGIPPKKREDILRSLDTLTKRTGMGLYLTKRLVEKFGGIFEIKCAKKGTEIILSIPMI